MKTFDEVISNADQLKTEYQGRNELFDEMEAMYFLDPREKSKLARMGDNIKVTISPDAANQLDGAVRLMVGSDPKFDVVNDLPDKDQIENFANVMWKNSGQLAGAPVHYDIILSALLYGEAHTGVISIRKLVELAQGKVNERMVKRALRMTPYIFETWSPRSCFARRGRLGLVEHYREIETTAGRIRQDWGKDADRILGTKSNKDPVTYCEWWDTLEHAAWLRGIAKPIYHDEHDLSFIPISHALAEGSTSLFSEPKNQLRPFLYKVAKSGLWNRDNLLMTVFFTMIFAIGANPMFKFRAQNSERELDQDWSRSGGTIKLLPGEDFESMIKNVIDPSIVQGKQMIDEKMAESTMYKQALGQPMSGGTPYSTVALLSQSGRLPLLSPQRRLSWMIAELAWTALMWLKEEGGGKYQLQNTDFDPQLITDDLDLRATLDINLPQDRLSLANIASILNQSGLVSREWIRTDILNITDNARMTYDVTKERLVDMLVGFVQEQLMAANQQTQQAPDTLPGGGGLPPEMMAGGMQGPEQMMGEPPTDGLL